MLAKAPSRQALRYLSNLCSNAEVLTPTLCTITRRTVCISSRNPRTTQTQHSPRFNLYDHRHFSSSSPSYNPSPSPSPETDPQNIANPTLPDITNYYTLFQNILPNGPPGPPPPTQTETIASSSSDPTPTAQFSIHIPTLRKEFLRLQSLHHPDKYPTGSSAHSKALALSAYINAAYKTLSDPLLRAQYLLQLQHDIDVTNEDNAAHPTDQETLMEVMEAQEQIEGATEQVQIDEIRDENARRILETEKVMGAAFEEGDVNKAKDECVRLKYWVSLQGALNDWEPGKEVKLIH